MKKIKGFTIVEILISLSVGLFLFAGVISVFVGMKTTTSETSSYGNMQETGRLAISILSDDVMRQGFWGDLFVPLNANILRGVPAAPAGECAGEGINNGTFPLPNGTFRAIWGTTVTAADNMGCITNAVSGSEILQLKRVVPNPLNAAPVGNFYLVANVSEGQIIAGGDAIPVINNSRIWEYQHHVYFVSEDSVGSEKVPVLNLRSLATTMNTQPLLDGVERLRVLYGIDRNLDGNANTFLSADNMTQAFWDNETTSRIVSIKLFVLVRDLLPDPKYTNSTSYRVGDVQFNAPNDHYRRMVFSSSVSLYNGDMKVW